MWTRFQYGMGHFGNAVSAMDVSAMDISTMDFSQCCCFQIFELTHGVIRAQLL